MVRRALSRSRYRRRRRIVTMYHALNRAYIRLKTTSSVADLARSVGTVGIEACSGVMRCSGAADGHQVAIRLRTVRRLALCALSFFC
jgi:hypothetical protein